MSKRKLWSGFTLVELMIVVAIIGLLAATAIPSYDRYIRRSKVPEAYINLRKIADGIMLYMETEQFDNRGVVQPRTFPAVVATPDSAIPVNTYPGCRYPANAGNWNLAGWEVVGFAIAGPHYYRYDHDATATSLQVVAGDEAHVQARGDLDCDGSMSDFRTYIRIGADLRPYRLPTMCLTTTGQGELE